MIYASLFEQAGNKQVNAGLVGTGTYGISLLALTQSNPRLNIPVICDQDQQTARIACMRAGIPEDIITICSDRTQILLAMGKCLCAIAENYELMLETPQEVADEVVACAEAGAGMVDLHVRTARETRPNIFRIFPKPWILSGKHPTSLFRIPPEV